MMKSENMSQDIDKFMILSAEQQLTGYSHAIQGHSLDDLLESMGLTEREWNVICHNDGFHLPDKLVKEIEEYFRSK